MIKTLNPTLATPLTNKDINEFTISCPAHLIHEKILHEAYKQNKEKIFQKTPPQSRHILPSILNSKIPTTLLKPCRQIKENRLSNTQFITAIRRSHRIKIFKEEEEK